MAYVIARKEAIRYSSYKVLDFFPPIVLTVSMNSSKKLFTDYLNFFNNLPATKESANF